MAQPGEQRLYNTGLQVLGVFIERASGKTLEAFLRERLFYPLHMPDTGFMVSATQRPRFTTPGRGKSLSPTASRTASGTSRFHFPTRPAGCFRPSTITGRSCR